jgi:hypothetical protein
VVLKAAEIAQNYVFFIIKAPEFLEKNVQRYGVVGGGQ